MENTLIKVILERRHDWKLHAYMAPNLMTIVNHLNIKNLLVRQTTYTENLSRPQPVLVASGDRTSGNVDAWLGGGVKKIL